MGQDGARDFGNVAGVVNAAMVGACCFQTQNFHGFFHAAAFVIVFFNKQRFEVEVTFHGLRVCHAMVFAVLFELGTVVSTPATPDKGFGSYPFEELSESDGEGGGAVDICLGDGGQLGTKITELGFANGFDEDAEFFGALRVGVGHEYGPDFDGLHSRLLVPVSFPACGF